MSGVVTPEATRVCLELAPGVVGSETAGQMCGAAGEVDNAPGSSLRRRCFKVSLLLFLFYYFYRRVIDKLREGDIHSTGVWNAEWDKVKVS